MCGKHVFFIVNHDSAAMPQRTRLGCVWVGVPQPPSAPTNAFLWALRLKKNCFAVPLERKE
jgi:hypothetical protein